MASKTSFAITIPHCTFSSNSEIQLTSIELLTHFSLSNACCRSCSLRLFSSIKYLLGMHPSVVRAAIKSTANWPLPAPSSITVNSPIDACIFCKCAANANAKYRLLSGLVVKSPPPPKISLSLS